LAHPARGASGKNDSDNHTFPEINPNPGAVARAGEIPNDRTAILVEIGGRSTSDGPALAAPGGSRGPDLL
jgi:hypothetical protein